MTAESTETVIGCAVGVNGEEEGGGCGGEGAESG